MAMKNNTIPLRHICARLESMMIGILLNDNAYEQDIRELLMAFYSGETFAHQKGAEVSFYVEGTVNETRD